MGGAGGDKLKGGILRKDPHKIPFPLFFLYLCQQIHKFLHALHWYTFPCHSLISIGILLFSSTPYRQYISSRRTTRTNFIFSVNGFDTTVTLGWSISIIIIRMYINGFESCKARTSGSNSPVNSSCTCYINKLNRPPIEMSGYPHFFSLPRV